MFLKCQMSPFLVYPNLSEIWYLNFCHLLEGEKLISEIRNVDEKATIKNWRDLIHHPTQDIKSEINTYMYINDGTYYTTTQRKAMRTALSRSLTAQNGIFHCHKVVRKFPIPSTWLLIPSSWPAYLIHVTTI